MTSPGSESPSPWTNRQIELVAVKSCKVLLRSIALFSASAKNVASTGTSSKVKTRTAIVACWKCPLARKRSLWSRTVTRSPSEKVLQSDAMAPLKIHGCLRSTESVLCLCKCIVFNSDQIGGKCTDLISLRKAWICLKAMAVPIKVINFTLKLQFMNCTIHVYLLNDLYSQKLADEKHNGKETEDNRKYLWEDEMRITSDVVELEELQDVGFPLQGQLPDGEVFTHEVSGMYLIRVKSSDAPDVFIGASSSIVSHCNLEQTGDFKIELFLKDDEPYANPIPGIYIASKEFPKALMQ